MIREVKREKKAPKPRKRSSRLTRLLAFVLTIALVVGAIYLVVNRDRLNFDALKRWFTYRSLAQGDDGNGQPFSYQGGASLTLANCGGDLLAVSQTGARLYSSGGTAYIQDTFTMTNPVCQVSGDSAVVYDAGGATLRVYQDRERVFDLGSTNATILSARLSDSGQLCVVSRASGFKGVISVYDDNFHHLMDLQLSSSYVLDAVTSPDGRSLLAVTAGQDAHLFTCTLARYSFSELKESPKDPTPTHTWSLGNRLPLDLVWDSDGLRILSEYATLGANASLEEQGVYDWSDRYLKRYSLLGDDTFAVLTGKYRSGSQTTLEIVEPDGEILASADFSLPILDLSAAGKYVGVLTARELNIYTRDLSLYATIENTENASHLAMLPDGSAYLASQSAAWLCLS